MPVVQSNYQQTWLWKHVFVNSRPDATIEEQEFFRTQFMSMRDKVSHLVGLIAVDMPGMTVHDVTHLDALWGTASLVAEGYLTLTPPEGFVLGASILLHDSAMTLAAYPGGVEQIQKELTWKDVLARRLQANPDLDKGKEAETPSEETVRVVLPEVLRRLHAKQAVNLAKQHWITSSGEHQYLIEDNDLRHFYGETIGQIAYSHWWDIKKVEREFSENLGAFAQVTHNVVDRTKIACLLRVADALHMDELRSPRFLRTLTKPQGISEKHWTFQEKLARPHIEADAVVFTNGEPFNSDEDEAWWLAFDMLSLAHKELRDVDLLLQSRGKGTLKACRVKGIETPEALSKLVQTKNWRPVNARIQVSDVPRIVNSLGGSKLYGDDPFIPVRELIQNAADAVQARRRYQARPENWGEICVSIKKSEAGYWLIVEDNGIGMSEQVLTGPLLDFGTSFWRSSLVAEEFPGLMASGMEAIGRFGIGFFSVFMLGQVVRVISRRYDKGEETAQVLEIRGGAAGRPRLLPAERGQAPLDGGTRVEVLLKNPPGVEKGLLFINSYPKRKISLHQLVASLAPGLGVTLSTQDDTEDDKSSKNIVKGADWVKITDSELLARLVYGKDCEKDGNFMRPLTGADGTVFGRATIAPVGIDFWGRDSACVTVSGLKANKLANVHGVLTGEVTTAVRDLAIPLVPKDVLSSWASEQAKLLSGAKLPDEEKAETAETILTCGGKIGDLPIVRCGTNWLNSTQLAAKVAQNDELLVYFDGAFDYDEDSDEMHPRDFRYDFHPDENVIIVPRHSGNMIAQRGVYWPANLFEWNEEGTRIASLVKSIIHEAWSGEVQRDEQNRVVGIAAGFKVLRDVTIFSRASEEESEASAVA